MEYVLKFAQPMNSSSSFPLTDISQGQKKLDPRILKYDMDMTSFVLFDLNTFNFFWCSRVGSNHEELTHCFLDMYFKSLSSFNELFNRNVFVSIERVGNDEYNNCTTIDHIRISENSLTSEVLKSSDSLFSPTL